MSDELAAIKIVQRAYAATDAQQATGILAVAQAVLEPEEKDARLCITGGLIAIYLLGVPEAERVAHRRALIIIAEIQRAQSWGRSVPQ
jgi:hypothetical protein